MNPNLVSLPSDVLQVIAILESIGFVYCEQHEFVRSDIDIELGRQIIIGDFAIESIPGVLVFHIPSGYWWFHQNDEFSVELTEKMLSLFTGR